MKKNKLPLSIIIPCATDIRIKTCLDSIDENVEIVVVLNGPIKEVVNIVKKYPVKVVTLPERNLPKSLNAGIEKATNKKFILMDSDCVFHPQAIKKIFLALNNNFVAKGKVIFQYNNLISRSISRVRDYTNADTVKAYNPFLGLRKDLADKIGGFFFHGRYILDRRRRFEQENCCSWNKNQIGSKCYCLSPILNLKARSK